MWEPTFLLYFTNVLFSSNPNPKNPHKLQLFYLAKTKTSTPKIYPEPVEGLKTTASS
jgi:hypothetical protein